MRKIWSVAAAAIAAATLSGCVENGGAGYVESRVINEGRVGSVYQGPVSGGVVVAEPTYNRGRPPVYRDRYADRGYRDGYGDRGYRDGYSDRGYRDGYGRDGYRARADRNYCADVGYQDPRCG